MEIIRQKSTFLDLFNSKLCSVQPIIIFDCKKLTKLASTEHEFELDRELNHSKCSCSLMRTTLWLFLWIIWHLKGKLCNGVFDYLLKVLSPFNAPKVVHRINTQHNNGNFENFPKRKWRLKNTWDDQRLSHSQREPK